MSRTNSSLLHTIREAPTADAVEAEHRISLVDHAKPVDVVDEDVPLNKITSTTSGLQQSIRQQLDRRKYARYAEDRYECAETGQHDQGVEQAREADGTTPISYLGRGRAKAAGLLKRKRAVGKADTQDTVVDILYENQRGSFLFGIPRYSSNSLLPSDPKPWQNAQFRTSPVDIRNAQVPDPSWNWTWKSWYVDMSRDVDEEGWEYSFAFKAGFNWHGNHPWFHSFVRRRRWLRMRRRRDLGHHVTKEKAHELTAEYFTIHPKTLKAASGAPNSQTKTSEWARLHAKRDEEPDIEKMDITDIASLMRALRKAAVDREKLLAVRKFVAEAEDELYYLSQQMPQIMGLFLYQSSRRQLLADLISHYDETQRRQENLKAHSHEGNDDRQRDHDAAVRHAENLISAVRAADELVKRLEYWSDIKEMAQDDELLHTGHWRGNLAADGTHPKPAFESKQHATEPAPQLHKHPEHAHHTQTHGKGKGRARDVPAAPPPSKKPPIWFDTKQSLRSPDSSEDGASSLERYTTAAESASDLGSPESRGEKKRGKSRAAMRSLDGVVEVEAGADAARDAGDADDILIPASDEGLEPETSEPAQSGHDDNPA